MLWMDRWPMPLLCAEKGNSFSTEWRRGSISVSRKLGNQILRYKRSAIESKDAIVIFRCVLRRRSGSFGTKSILYLGRCPKLWRDLVVRRQVRRLIRG